MRQISYHLNTNPVYGIIGNGYISKHIRHYFEVLNIPYLHWHRGKFVSPENILSESSILILAISDDAIDPFLDNHPTLNKKLCIHFSGSLTSTHALSYHPLMTFGPKLYDEQFYKNILFVGEHGSPLFTKIFPKLKNPHIQIPNEKKPYYHALCVIANNFTTLLWKKFFDEMSTEFKASFENLKPYLHQTFLNIDSDYQNALTGPLKRNDLQTIERNLNALNNDPFADVYLSFVKAYQNETQTGRK